MAARLKTYVCSRVLEILKMRNNGHVLPSTLSNQISIVKNKDGNSIEFCLPVTSLQKSIYFKSTNEVSSVNMSEIMKINTNGIICDVLERGHKKNTNLVFQINKHLFLKEVLQEIRSDPVLWRRTVADGILPDSAKKTVIVEFSSPNIAKPFHLGHLRSTIIGNFISNLLEFLSCNVIRLNYLGDWGTQFGLLQVGLDLCGYTEDMIRQNPIQLLYLAYVEANKRAETDPAVALKARDIFRSLEGDSELILDKWKEFRNYTVQELQNIYQRLGVRFSDYHWESMYSAKDIGRVLDSLRNSGILTVDDKGRHIVEINENMKVPILKSDGSTLYLTRDIAAAIDRYKRYEFSEMLYVVDTAQNYHFSSLFGVLSKMNLPWAPSLKHIRYGRIHGMSTRKGSAVFLNDILDESKNIMATKQLESPTTKISLDKGNERITDILGISAVIINDLKQRRVKDYEFDWDRVLQVQGDTGIKLQYTHCRLCSLEKNCGVNLPEECDPSLLEEPEAVLLVVDIARFQEVIMKSYEELEACILVNYLLRFCNTINHAFQVLKIKNEDKQIGSQRLLLFHASRIVLSEGMKILGLQPLQEM